MILFYGKKPKTKKEKVIAQHKKHQMSARIHYHHQALTERTKEANNHEPKQGAAKAEVGAKTEKWKHELVSRRKRSRSRAAMVFRGR